MMSTIRYLLKHRSWPSRLQRDFMSRNPDRQARVRAVADAINAQIDAEDGRAGQERRDGQRRDAPDCRGPRAACKRGHLYR